MIASAKPRALRGCVVPDQEWRNGPVAVPAFLSGGGEAGALMRAVDWGSTPVGPVDGWPASLKTTIGTILHSRHPMFLWWGPDLIQFYNDAYVPSFGKGKRPAAMGQRGADCWQEIWPIIWPQIDDVMRHGRPSWHEDHLVPIFRNGRIEEVYWTYGYSPVIDDDGRVGGTLVVCTETTNRVVAGRRLQSMRALAEATTLATDAEAVIDRAAGVLADAPRDVAFALLYASDPYSHQARLLRSVGVPADTAGAIDAHLNAELASLASADAARPMPRAVRVIGAVWPEPVSEIFLAPVGSHGERATGYVLFGISPRLPFDAAYRDYLRQLGEHIAQGQARVDAFRVRALVESERNNLLEQAPVATALLVGPDHVFRLANPLYRQMVGRGDDIVGRAYLDVFPELRGTPLPGILDAVYTTGQPFVSHEVCTALDRGGGVLEDCYFRFNLEPLRHASGQVYGMMAVAVDITSQVVARKDLERTQVEREHLLRDLEAASRAKDEFLAMLGHELRNPLSPILTALQLMRLRGIHGAERERDIIERQVRHVVRLVDDLLDVSRIARGTIELKPDRTRLADAVARAIEQASPIIEQRRHRLRVEVPDDLYVHADPGRISQVISNILTNAAKYTDPGGDIDVRAARHDAEAWLHVRDSGIGIGPEMLPRVFDAFAQEHQRSDRAPGGLGLGLAIVKNLIEAHGGGVTLRSEGTGRGTECVVRLPLAAMEHQPPDVQSESAALATAGGCRVMVVDDNADAASMLWHALGGLGHRVEVAHDASSALQLSTRYVPHVALLDLGLPVIDGFELAKRLRTQAGWDSVRFAALTGYGQESDRERTRAAGFHAHLVKPIDIDELDTVVRQLASPEAAPGSSQG